MNRKPTIWTLPEQQWVEVVMAATTQCPGLGPKSAICCLPNRRAGKSSNPGIQKRADFHNTSSSGRETCQTRGKLMKRRGRLWKRRERRISSRILRAWRKQEALLLRRRRALYRNRWIKGERWIKKTQRKNRRNLR